MGFDGIFVPEHHMMDDGYLPIHGPCWVRSRRGREDRARYQDPPAPLYHPMHVAEAARWWTCCPTAGYASASGSGNFPLSSTCSAWSRRRRSPVSRSASIWSSGPGRARRSTITVSTFRSRERSGPSRSTGDVDGSDVGARFAPGGAVRLKWVTDPLHNVDVMKQWSRPLPRVRSDQDTSKAQATCSARRLGRRFLQEVERAGGRTCAATTGSTSPACPRCVVRPEPTYQDPERERLPFDVHRRRRLIVGSPQDCIERSKSAGAAGDDLPDPLVSTVAAGRATSRSSSVSGASAPR